MSVSPTSSGSPLALSGLGSGLDTASIVSQLMAVERRPVQMMQKRVSTDQAQLKAYQAINSKLLALQNAAKNLASGTFNLSPMANKTATSGNSALFTATASSTATAGSYSVNVTALAFAQKTGGGTFTSPGAAGTIHIAGSDGTNTSIAVAAGATASDVANSINGSSSSQFNAAVLTQGGANVLVLTAKQTGISYKIDDGTAGAYAFTSSLGISTDGTATPSGTNFTYQAAQQAALKVDGQFNFTSNTNQFTAALPGVTINAIATGTSTLTVAQDTAGATAAVQGFVNAFNDVVKEIQTDTKYDPASKSGGPLLGDPFVEHLGSQLTGYLTNNFNLYNSTTSTYGSDPTYNGYGAAGISVQRDGTLSLDATKLTTALQSNSQAVFQLFGQNDNATQVDSFGKNYNVIDNNQGIAQRISGFVDSLIGTASQWNPTSDATGTRVRGGLLAHLDGINATISDINKQIDSYNQRLTLRQQTLQNQFLAMEKSISAIHSQGNYLTGQLAKLSGG